MVPFLGLQIFLRHIEHSTGGLWSGKGPLPGRLAVVPALSLIHFDSTAKEPQVIYRDQFPPEATDMTSTSLNVGKVQSSISY